MIASHHLPILLIGLVVMGWGARVYAESDVTVVTPPAAATTPPRNNSVAPDGTPVVHKSLHKKTHAVATSGTTAPAATTTASGTPASATKPVVPPTPSIVATTHSVPAPIPAKTQPPSSPPIRTVSLPSAFDPGSLPSVTSPSPSVTALGPAVETGLPVARHPGDTAVNGILSIPAAKTLSPGKSLTGATTHQTIYASAFPPLSTMAPITSSTIGAYSSVNRTTSPPNDFVFTNFNRKVKNFYPWKTGIITTMFWIGEPGSNLSPTDNVASAWDENWRQTNRGSDNPYDRNGYAPADHAPTVNTFYVALPFNDLAYPDKTRRWLPAGWHRPRGKDGKEVSACKDRWVEIKNAQGRTCYAQWEDVGPLVSDHAEYVFGNERPDTLTRAGLDVSPAVADYLDINGKNRITSWRFVDDEDVQPGAWLRYEELALLYSAMHQQKSVISTSNPPIQRAVEPIDDPSSVETNKKKVDASKG